MNNRIGGFTVIGKIHRRTWNGIIADVTQVACEADAGGFYVARDPRLFIMLDAQGDGQPLIRMSPGDRGFMQQTHQPAISYVPAGMDLRVDLHGLRQMRHLDIHFDAGQILQRLGEDLDPRRLQDPHLLFSDARVQALGQLIASECVSETPLHDLYGDGLALSLILAALRLERAAPRMRSALAGWQLRRVLDFIEAHCLRAIRLEELAALTGLSQSQFSHGFKRSTGSAPHQWQMIVRIRKAQQLLVGGSTPLSAIAAETGFSDQAHFTRTFRKVTGTTPAHWRRAHQ